ENTNQSLDNIESQLTFQHPKPKIQNLESNHSTQEKFLNLEELAYEITGGFKDEKACPYEPTGKPCDHCAMCNSRGF
ncbi:MAG: hypothetical protein LH472_02290, partial [Pyrinomonadaceae bacterium]|nr:hypothetical protein [Pyrinomonadaceae bacterium]